MATVAATSSVAAANPKPNGPVCLPIMESWMRLRVFAARKIYTGETMSRSKQVLAVAATALAGSASALAYYAISYPQSQLFGPTLVAPPEPNQIALTFDDGPNPSATPRLLEALARHNVRATFFLIGSFARLEPALTREIAAAGHLVGNHTMTHPFLPRLGYQQIRAQLSDCNRALEDIIGRRPNLFRPPHGARSPAVFRAAAALHLEVVQWNLMVDDWKQVSADTILGRIERGISRNRARRVGTNLVLHDGGQAGRGPASPAHSAGNRAPALSPARGYPLRHPARWL